MRLNDLPGIADVNVATVRDYLKSRGWKMERQHAPDLYEYRLIRDDGESRFVQVVGPTYRDHRLRTAELLEMLAETHRVPVLSLLDVLTSPPGDIIEIHLASSLTRSGTIPVQDAARIRLAQQGLLLAAAHAELEPLPHYPRLSRREATELLARCREGQTARGSYQIRLIVPVIPQVGLFQQPPPFERRVTQRLMRAAKEATDAVYQDREDDLLTKHRLGVSSNFLKSLSEMAPPGDDGTVGLSVRWSRNRPPPQSSPAVHIERWVLEHFRAAAATLREKTPERGFQLQGYVINLRRGPDEVDGLVDVLAELEEGRHRKVRVRLDEANYLRAVRAHEECRRIETFGTLKRRGRTFKLISPSQLRLLPTVEEADPLGELARLDEE